MRGLKYRRVEKDRFNSADLITFKSPPTPGETSVSAGTFTLPFFFCVRVHFAPSLLAANYKTHHHNQEYTGSLSTHVHVAVSWGIYTRLIISKETRLCNRQYGEMQSSRQAAPAPLRLEAGGLAGS